MLIDESAVYREMYDHGLLEAESRRGGGDSVGRASTRGEGRGNRGVSRFAGRARSPAAGERGGPWGSRVSPHGTRGGAERRVEATARGLAAGLPPHRRARATAPGRPLLAAHAPPPRALALLAPPYKARVALALGFLLLATMAALASVSGRARIDDGISEGDLRRSAGSSAPSSSPGSSTSAPAPRRRTSRAGRESASSRTPAALPSPPAPVARLLQRNRAGVIISRLTNDVDALDQLVTEGVTSLLKNTLLLLELDRSSFFSTGGSRSRHSS